MTHVVDKVVAIILCGVVIFGALYIGDAINTWRCAKTQAKKYEPKKDQRPTIPKCDKDLWDRVKDGCKDE